MKKQLTQAQMDRLRNEVRLVFITIGVIIVAVAIADWLFF